MSAGLIIGILAGVLVLLRVVGRQVTGSLVSQRSLFLLPGILVVIGLASVSSALGTATPGELAFLILDCVVLLGLGVARGASVRLTNTPDGLWQKGTSTTLILWLLTIGLRVGGVLVSSAVWPHGVLSRASIALTIGITIGAQNAMIFRRALGMHIPLATQRA
ncbi:hypothetical protein E1263_36880 [Kribbella antibiotica]|uniref:DUF1453 domain-containing protein n=1 Tax=Kribbella antibiotica TaxID=190195 RepID=A0A4R4YPL7_9ACTN|nr:hypothetical protein [Kribbella antibiotica]TDD46224.1 hypothetical protein E1263_36880 [Kribbella antibiotica]